MREPDEWVNKKPNKIIRMLEDKARKYLNVLSGIEDGFYEVDMAGNLLFFNDSLRQMLGYTNEEMLGMNYKKYMSTEDAQRVYKVFNHVYRTKESTKGFDWQLICKDETKVIVETSVSPIVGSNGTVTGFLGIIRDITERKKAEQAVKESERRLADIINFLPDATFVIDMNGKIIIWNCAAEKMTGVNAEDIIGKGEYEYAIPFYGSRRPMLIDLITNPAKQEETRFLRLEKYNNIVVAEDFCPALGKCGRYCWGTAAPLYDTQGKLIGAIESLRDITMRQQIEEALQESLDRLQIILKSTVDALATTTEKRDMFTAGHQRRVALLAGAIAREMNISEEKINDISMAATLHDIGKMQISSDILSKPGKLTDIEMLLVRTHAQVSYEIIKTIPFSSSVADIAFQHHERLDGSGYPCGLSGKDILMESRILAVADVVEAMSSHRPYRPALGLEMAMEEINSNSGKLYDPDVVEACLNLIKQNKLDFLG